MFDLKYEALVGTQGLEDVQGLVCFWSRIPG